MSKSLIWSEEGKKKRVDDKTIDLQIDLHAKCHKNFNEQLTNVNKSSHLPCDKCEFAHNDNAKMMCSRYNVHVQRLSLACYGVSKFANQH